ncbi:MAG TPA: PEP-CTERM sorting domain-containing protein, partial [Thermodesulfobacteriota bacterium]|nr:PEP-CTERM sorting domain-containing protein [Thermodesulfobacteriota bacterium]
TAQSWAALYSGSISSSDGTLVAGDRWANANVSLSWEVDYDTASHPDLWTYSYNFAITNGPQNAQGISHVIIQTSEGVTESALFPGTTADADVDEYGSEGGSNPGWEGSIFNGIKWNVGGDTLTLQWTVVTDHSPMWGDFYSKGGQSYAYNLGMDEDLTPVEAHANIANGNNVSFDDEGNRIAAYVLVPNSIGGPPSEVPAPASLLLFGSGLMGVSLIRRKREKK